MGTDAERERALRPGLRTRLGDRAYERCQTHGQRLTRRVVAYALGPALVRARDVVTEEATTARRRLWAAWGLGRLEPLHPDAYRDIVLNFTGIWIVVALVVTLAPSATQRLRDPRASDTAAE